MTLETAKTDEIRGKHEADKKEGHPLLRSSLTMRDVDTLFRALDEARDVLKKMVLWHGGIHGPDCPQDDTCNCEGKPINDRIEQILKGGGDDE